MSVLLVILILAGGTIGSLLSACIAACIGIIKAGAMEVD